MNKTVLQILQNSLAPSTKSAYQNAVRHYQRFHATYHTTQAFLPISVHKLAQFIAVSHESGLKPASITSFISALTYLHRINGFKNPAKSFVIQKLLHSIRKGNQLDRRQGITLTILKSFTSSLDRHIHNVYKRQLFKTMFLVAFFALLRIGEITYTELGHANIIQRENVSLSFKNSKVDRATIKMKSFKHSQGDSAVIVLHKTKNKTICPVRALYKYFALDKAISGPLFRNKNGNPVSARFFRSLLRRCVLDNDLDPKLYTAHSFRIGGATFAHDNNLSNTQIQHLGRWRSQAFIKYIRPLAVSLDVGLHK